MNPELLTIEVPDHLIKSIKEKLDGIFDSKSASKQIQRQTKISENSEVGRKILTKNSKRSLKSKESKIPIHKDDDQISE